MSRADQRRRCRGGGARTSPAGDAFVCQTCGAGVPGEAFGTQHRNHCPRCLWSRHVDVAPGDRLSGCRAAMEPIAVSVKKDGEWMLVHRCRGCGALRANRIAGDDDEFALLSLAARPIASPPFSVPRYRAAASPEGR